MSLIKTSHIRSKRQHRVDCGNAVPPKDSYLIDSDYYDEAVFEEAVLVGLPQPYTEELKRSFDELNRAQRELIESTLDGTDLLIPFRLANKRAMEDSRPPLNAEYVLYLFLHKDERECVIGDLIESYGRVVERFNKRRADIWFYKQVAGSLWPLLRRVIVKFGAFVWLGRMLRRLIS